MEDIRYRSRRDFDRVSVVESMNREFGVIDHNGNVIVPFGRYAWIDGFDSGLARVRTEGMRYMDPRIECVFDDNMEPVCGDALKVYYDKLKRESPEDLSRWGIINTDGEEVLPVRYDNIWNFLGKNRTSTYVEKDGRRYTVDFYDLPGYYDPCVCEDEDELYGFSDFEYCERGRHYGEYAGSYAQDVMGYSDEDIEDIFDGDPDAYWNID